VDPRASLDDVEKRKFLTLLGFELQPLVVQPVGSRYTDCATPSAFTGARVSVVGSGTMLQTGRSRVRVTIKFFFHCSNT
jgi:hypothetical protein